jgi:hypothetical protein
MIYMMTYGRKLGRKAERGNQPERPGQVHRNQILEKVATPALPKGIKNTGDQAGIFYYLLAR